MYVQRSKYALYIEWQECYILAGITYIKGGHKKPTKHFSRKLFAKTVNENPSTYFIC